MKLRIITSLGLSAAAMTAVTTMWCHTTQYVKDFSESLQLQSDIIYNDALLGGSKKEKDSISDGRVGAISTVSVTGEQKKVEKDTDIVESESNNVIMIATEPEISSESEEEEETVSFDNTNDEEKIFVVHAGPHESYSTSLQHFIFKNNALKDALKSDNYQLPIFRQGQFGSKNPKNHATLAHCFLGGKQNVYCSKDIQKDVVREFKLFVNSAANDGSNIVVSSEEFILESLDVKALTNILEARKYKPHIVLNYRRFYSWIRSTYDARNKLTAEKGESFPTFQSWLQRKIKPIQTKYTKAVYDRFKNIQEFADVTILNLHDNKKSLQEQFFCDHVNEAPQSCSLAKNHNNGGTDDLLQSADWKSLRAKLLLGEHHPIKLQRNGDDVRWKQIEEKFMNARDLPRICLTNDLKNRLLEMSIEFEMALTPEEWYNSDEGLENLRADFEEKLNSRLCSIDVPATLLSPEWQSFLTALDA